MAKSKKAIADAIQLQRGMVRALKSDVERPEKIDLMITKKREQIEEWQKDILRLETRKATAGAMLEEAKKKLKLLIMASQDERIAELMKLNSKIEELKKDDD